MNCQVYQQWISDDMDGALGETNKRKLERHLESCENCRRDRVQYQRFQEELDRIPKPRLTPDYWRNFSARLERKIRLIPSGKPEPRLHSFRWYWAWMGAGVTAVLALGLIVLFSRQSLIREQYIFSFEDSIQNIYDRIGNNLELERAFDSLLQNAIEENAGMPGKIMFHFSDDPLFWDNLSDEDIRALDNSIKNEIKS